MTWEWVARYGLPPHPEFVRFVKTQASPRFPPKLFSHVEQLNPMGFVQPFDLILSPPIWILKILNIKIF